MIYNDIIKPFKEGTQKWKIVNHILTFKKIYNHEIHQAYGICCHSARISEIRKQLAKIGHTIICYDGDSPSEHYYKIRKFGEVKYEQTN